MIATLNGKIHGQTVVLDREIPKEYDGATVSIYVEKAFDAMSVEERMEALEALSGRGGQIFPDNVNSYIRSIRDDNR